MDTFADLPKEFRISADGERLEMGGFYVDDLFNPAVVETIHIDFPQNNYQQLLEQIHERPDAHVIQMVMLRSLSQAVYSPDESGHFGLGYSSYAHFTSPIRRYPDLMVHRAIKSIIHRKESAKDVEHPAVRDPELAEYPYDLARMVQLGEHCSMTERRADDATRDVMAWLKCEFLREHVGETYGGVIAIRLLEHATPPGIDRQAR